MIELSGKFRENMIEVVDNTIIGVNTFCHVFFVLLSYTNNLKLTIFLAERAVLLYTEFIIMSKEAEEESNLRYKPTNKDAMLFSYKKTIGPIKLSDISNNSTMRNIKFTGTLVKQLYLDFFKKRDGEITLDEVTGSGFSGSFDGSFIMASSVSFMTISNGSFVHTIPGSEFLPGIPQSLTATVSGTEVDLNWTLNDDWFTSNYYVYHSNMANDGFEYLASVDATTSTVIHNDPLDGNNYYYITAANLVAIESNPSNTAMVFVEASTYNMGDVNMDDTINVLDIVILVNFILDQAEPTELQFELSDLNGDGGLNVLDIVQLVNIILEQ